MQCSVATLHFSMFSTWVTHTFILVRIILGMRRQTGQNQHDKNQRSSKEP